MTIQPCSGVGILFPAPTPAASPGSRINGLDLAPAVAIAGMVLVNFQGALAYGTDSGGWFQSLVDGITGRAAATFVLHYYGVYMLLCCLLLGASGTVLWILAILLVIGHVGFHPLVPWLTFMLVGMWVGRLELGSVGTQKKLLVAGLVAAVPMWRCSGS